MKEETYKYPRQFIVGVWLITVGIAMMTLVIKLPNGIPNAAYFGVIYALGMFWQLNSRTRKRFSVGSGTIRQKKWANRSIVILMALVFLSFLPAQMMHLSGMQAVYVTWVMILIGVGLHFLAFIPVHGKIIGILGLVIVLNGLFGLFVRLPLDMIFISDGLIKIIFGLVYLKVSPINF
ncbi:hypothetical protein JMJ99_00890 [Companilactobacillus zhachilii]|uniref:DUF6609 family protein n=1 Tax=Companilactobacillus zhachilii TaxID=2304606 RepID=UPI001923A137|nr:DUF6609 family protein [Companilactobacillus zhachilii]MBL3529906.1 hypothetical protein [Companilactobacillus zhachilii]